MSENKEIDKILKLTPEMLEQITGGVMTDRAETLLNALIIALKKDTAAAHTPEEMIAFVRDNLMDNVNFEGVAEQDVADYVNANW